MAREQVQYKSPSGFSKFPDSIGEFLYDQSMEWRTDELGDVQDFGWYGLLIFGEPVEVIEEGEVIETFEGAMLKEDNYGFITYETFATEEEAREAWAAIEDEYREWYEEYGEKEE